MYCFNCGKELPNEAKFCSSCGNSLNFTAKKLTEEKNSNPVESKPIKADTTFAKSKKMTFTEAIASCFSKYAVFEGRASRSEYWWFYLFIVLIEWGYDIVLALSIPDESTRLIPQILFGVAVLLPQLSAATRRLHDTGKSGWNQLWMFTIIGIIPLIIWLASEGNSETNEYGETEK